MSAALYRVRKRVKNEILRSHEADDVRNAEEKKAALYIRAGLQQALSFIDDELEADSEREFVKPIKPSDPLPIAVPAALPPPPWRVTNAIAGETPRRGVVAHG